jgi:hypothetical protein
MKSTGRSMPALLISVAVNADRNRHVSDVLRTLARGHDNLFELVGRQQAWYCEQRCVRGCQGEQSRLAKLHGFPVC